MGLIVEVLTVDEIKIVKYTKYIVFIGIGLNKYLKKKKFSNKKNLIYKI